MLDVTIVVGITPQGKKTPNPTVLGKRVHVGGTTAVIAPRGHARKDPATEMYEADLAGMIEAQWPEGVAVGGRPLTVDFLHVVTRPKRRPAGVPKGLWSDGIVPSPAKPDWDNLVKSSQDALFVVLRKHAKADDAIVAFGRAAKAYAEVDGRPRVVINVREVDDDAWPPLWVCRLAETVDPAAHGLWVPL